MNVMCDVILDYIICQKMVYRFMQYYAVFKSLARNVFNFKSGMSIMKIRYIASQPSIIYRIYLLGDSSMICLQVYVTFTVSYKKDVTSDDVIACADVVKTRFKEIEGGSFLGLKKLKEITPDGLNTTTASYKKTKFDGFTCPEGELLQDKVCGELLPV